MKLIYFFPLVLLFINGCGKPTIDTSSDEKMVASIAKVKSSLPKDKHDEFEEAIQFITFIDFDLFGFFKNTQIDTGSTERKMKETLDGKTAEEVFALAEKISLERKAESLEQEVESLKMDNSVKRDKKIKYFLKLVN